jgi:hypothetical protein
MVINRFLFCSNIHVRKLCNEGIHKLLIRDRIGNIDPREGAEEIDSENDQK